MGLFSKLVTGINAQKQPDINVWFDCSCLVSEKLQASKKPPPKQQQPQKQQQQQQQQQPQMVTIKRVMEPNGAEPTVTITLRGATPNEDKVLYTLLNGQGNYS